MSCLRILRSTELAHLLSVLIREYSTPLDAAIDMDPIQKLRLVSIIYPHCFKGQMYPPNTRYLGKNYT